jgi:hypothetical protein
MPTCIATFFTKHFYDEMTINYCENVKTQSNFIFFGEIEGHLTQAYFSSAIGGGVSKKVLKTFCFFFHALHFLMVFAFDTHPP